MNKLILFDIDETLIKPYGVGRRSLTRSLAQFAGKELITDGLNLSGRCDPQICLEMLESNNIEPAKHASIMAQALELYPQILAEEIKKTKDYCLHEGVIELLDLISATAGLHLGLLTGNIEAGARIKLSFFNLNSYFPFGAFGSDSDNRNHLPAIAQMRAYDKLGIHFDFSDMIIIGDSRNDVLCAKHAGAICIAVSTGRTTKDELSALKPEFLFPSLEDKWSILNAIINNAGNPQPVQS